MSARAAPASANPGTGDGRRGSAITSARICFRSANGRRLPPTSIAGPPPAGARPPPAPPPGATRPPRPPPPPAPRPARRPAPPPAPPPPRGPPRRGGAPRRGRAAPPARACSWPRGPRGAARGTRASPRAAPALQRARLSFRAQEVDELLRRRGEVLALPVDDPERPEEDLVREVHDRERLRLDLEPHRGLGQDGEPGADLDHALDGLHVHRARDRVGQRLEARLHVLVALDDLLAHLVKNLARGGELHVAARPLEEAATVAILEGADLLADRRLGHEVLGSGRGEAPGLDHVAEDLEGLEVHANVSGDGT